MKTFRFYFRDGNQRLFETENMYSALSYVLFILQYSSDDVVKIEEL